jgi:hypothetical protein
VWLANERTFLKWQHISILLGGLVVEETWLLPETQACVSDSQSDFRVSLAVRIVQRVQSQSMSFLVDLDARECCGLRSPSAILPADVLLAGYGWHRRQVWLGFPPESPTESQRPARPSVPTPQSHPSQLLPRTLSPCRPPIPTCPPPRPSWSPRT